jgi:hypothetical protein
LRTVPWFLCFLPPRFLQKPPDPKLGELTPGDSYSSGMRTKEIGQFPILKETILRYILQDSLGVPSETESHLHQLSDQLGHDFVT